MQVPQNMACTAFQLDESMVSDISSWNAMHGALLGLRDPSLTYTPEQVHIMQAACHAAGVKPPRAAPSEQMKPEQVNFDRLLT